MIERLAAASLVAVALVGWRSARAQCASPVGCICDSVAPTVYAVHAVGGGSADGGAVYAVTDAFGAVADGGPPSEITLPAGQAGTGLVAVSAPGQTGRVVPLDANGFTACGPSFSEAAAAHAMLQNGELACIRDLVPDADCDDAGCASASGAELFAFAACTSLIAIARRRRRH